MEKIIQACMDSNNPTFMKNISLEFFELLCNENKINESAYLAWADVVKDSTEIESIAMFVALEMIRKNSEEIFWEKLDTMILLLQNNLLKYKSKKGQENRGGGEDQENLEGLVNACINVIPDQ